MNLDNFVVRPKRRLVEKYVQPGAHFTEHGVMSAALLYESPSTEVTVRGPDGLFTPGQLDELLAVLDQVRTAALAS